jgi:TonB family protein
MQPLTYSLVWLGRLAVAVAVSFFLFTAVSFLHIAIGFGTKEDKGPQARKIALTEIVKKEPEVKKQLPQRIRQVQNNPSRGKSMLGQMAMRFTPDLTVGSAADGGAGVAMQKEDLNAVVFEQGQVDQDATPDYTPVIRYPERAAEQGLHGTVEVEFVVTHQGKISNIVITKSPSPIFSSAVKSGVATWRFKPAKNKGIPVNQRFRKAIDFNLNN